jgi:hypothetical protein
MKIVFLILMSIMILAASGQSVNTKPAGGNAQASALVFDQKEFGDRFSVMNFSENDYDYYVIDLTKLADRFERIYFLNLTYKDQRLINLDADIEKSQIWFKAYHQFNETEINCLFKDLKEKTAQTCQGMTSEEKSAWLAKNDKFKKDVNNE